MNSIAFDDSLFNQPVAKKPNSLLFAILASLLIHSFGVVYFYHHDFLNQTLQVTQPKVFLVEIVAVHPQSTLEENPPKSQPEPALTTQDDLVSHQKTSENDLAKPKKINSKSIKPNSNKAKAKKTDAKADSVAKKGTPSKIIQTHDFINAIRKTERTKLIQSSKNPVRGQYFNPELNAHAQNQAQEQERLEAIGAAKQRRKDNQRYEFASTGDSRLVRLDGLCFEVPEKKSMEIETRLWQAAGNCEIKEKLDFTTRKLDQEYQLGRSDF